MITSTTSPRRAALTRILVASAAIIGTFLIGGAGVAATYYPLRHASFSIDWLLVFMLMTGESAGIHLPSEVILPVGGWIVVREHHLGVAGVLTLSAIGAAGNTAGSGLLYLAGSAGGRPLVRRFGRYFLIREEDIDRAARRMGRRPAQALFVSRLLPVVRTYAGFPAGMLGVPARTFVTATFGGSFLWCLAFVSAGWLLGSHWGVLRLPLEVAGAAIAAFLLLALVVVTAKQLRTHSRH